MAGVHLVESGDVIEALVRHASPRLLQHVRREVDADDLQVLGIERERKAGAYAHLQHAAGAPVDDLDRMLAPLAGDPAEGLVVDRSPAAVGAEHRGFIQTLCSLCSQRSRERAATMLLSSNSTAKHCALLDFL